MPTPTAPRVRGAPRITNRLRAFLIHVPWYSIEGQRRLAVDCGVSSSTISRLVRQETSPTYWLARAVTDALSRRLGVPLDLREVFSTDGTYPTPCACDLTPACTGCFPPEAYDDTDSVRPEYRDLRPGDWCTYPPLRRPENENATIPSVTSLPCTQSTPPWSATCANTSWPSTITPSSRPSCCCCRSWATSR